uniref:Uncharacterized protein n=1 Tax=viral metagenome TaxID=1070528 RepID=A0A6C0KF61_9ZZZZ
MSAEGTLILYGGPPAVIILMIWYGIVLLSPTTDPSNPAVKTPATATRKMLGVLLILLVLVIVWFTLKHMKII